MKRVRHLSGYFPPNLIIPIRLWENLGKTTTRNIQQNTSQMPFKNIKVLRNRESLRNHHRPEETNETWRINVIQQDLGLDSGTERTLVEKLVQSNHSLWLRFKIFFFPKHITPKENKTKFSFDWAISFPGTCPERTIRTGGSQTSAHKRITWRDCYNQLAGPLLAESESARLGWGKEGEFAFKTRSQLHCCCPWSVVWKPHIEKHGPMQTFTTRIFTAGITS